MFERARVLAVPLFFVCDTNGLRFGVCMCMCVCVSLYFIVMLICGRLHRVSQDAVNLAGQTALEIDMHAHVSSFTQNELA